jgi:DNA-directed RNA polymerase I subunit RPA1
LGEFLDDKVIKKVHLEVPAIIKSKFGPIWTGKQVISTLLKNLSFDERDFIDQYRRTEVKYGLNLVSRSRLEAYNWGPLGSEEGQIYIRNNELLQGVLDKNQIGDSKFGLIHSFYELYGSK